MDRMEHLVKIADEFLTRKYFENAAVAERYFRLHKGEVTRQFSNVVWEGLARCKAKRKKVKYIIVSILESSILTKSYELQVAFFDERMYLDDESEYIYWVPLFLFEQIEDDIWAYRKKASQTVVRIKEYEIEQIFRAYAFNRYLDVYALLKDIIRDVLEQETPNFECLAEDVSILFGQYMEKSVLLYQRGGEEK